MNKKKGNILYGQSGGPTSVINSSFYGLIKASYRYKNKINKIFVMHYGIEGLLENDYFIIDPKTYKKYKKLINTSGAYCGSNRFKLKDEYHYKKILEFFKNNNIKYFFYNGGNDSMDTINKISKYLIKNNYDCKCIGIPKTIDNDLIGTDFSFGFPSAAKFVINSLININDDHKSYRVGRVNIVEIMGRNAGWLTASSLLASRYGVDIDLIYLPEYPFNTDEFIKKVDEIYSKKNNCLIVVSEGIKDINNNLISIQSGALDNFNHQALGGVSHFLANLIENKLHYKTRAIELSLLQRANSFSPSKIDRDLAIKGSKFILKNAIKGENDKMLTIEYKNNKYNFNFISLNEVANKERKMGEEFLDPSTRLIKDNYLDYVARLIKGNVNTFNKDGIIDHLFTK